MGPNVDYETDNVERENESSANVVYDVHKDKQTYHKKTGTKGLEKHCLTKYKTGGRGRSASHSSSVGRTISARRPSHSTATKCAASSNRKSHSSGGGHHGHRSASKGSPSKSCGRRPSSSKRTCSGGGGGGSGSGSKSLVERSAKCYDDRRHRRKVEPCDKSARWQHGTYVRDQCGSGIVPTRFDFRPSGKIWCKTPLSMYQATIGELARKILCREKVVPRDVRPAPPSNIEEYILPPCRGYYRKYDCLRPCEEQYVRYKGGQKQYRDRVERYWEPCISEEQKHKLSINEYAPQNAFLSKKLRRYNMRAGDNEPPCW